MELRRYLEVLGRRRLIVVTTTVVTLLVVGLASYLMTPIYSASATVRIAQVQDSSIDYYDLNYSVRLINTYVELVRSRPFLEQTVVRLALDIDPTDLAELVEAEAVANTELLRITAQSTDPRTAMMIADTLGQLLVEEGERLYSGSGKGASEILLDQVTGVETRLSADRERLQALLADESGEENAAEIQDLNTRIFVQEQTYTAVLNAYERARLQAATRANTVSIVDPALIPVEQSKPQIAINLALASLVGLFGGTGLAFLLENLDTAIYSAADLEQAVHAPLIGSIPKLNITSRTKNARLLLEFNGQSSVVEAFRALRTSVMRLDHGRPPRTLLVTSVEANAGKSTVLANLALALGEAGRNVVVVDSDLRQPSLNEFFRVSNEIGLKNVMVQSDDLGSAVQKTRSPGVQILPSGRRAHNPAELLSLASSRQLFTDLANWADLVLLDSPPLSKFSDALVLASMADSVVLVVSRGAVSGSQIQRAVDQLNKVGVDQIAVVFNRAGGKETDYQ